MEWSVSWGRCFAIALLCSFLRVAAGAEIGSESVAPQSQAGLGTSQSQANTQALYRLPPLDEVLDNSENVRTIAYEPPQDDYFTLAELQRELGDWSWHKSGFRIIPYGAFWADMLYATERTNTGPFTLYVFSRDTQGEGNFVIDARRSRFGFDVEGPNLPILGGARSGGRLEFDFFGDFVNENQAGLLLRHAYWQAEADQFRVLIGQTWDVISPLNPNTVNFSVGWLGGNIGFRRTQFRAERDFTLSPETTMTLQGSLNQDIVTDFPTINGVRRESSNWPVVQGRLALENSGLLAGGPLRWGMFGHIGETGFDFLAPGPPPLNLPPQDDARFQTWSFGFDFRAPLAPRLGVQGEFFTGANLSAFFGGIGQGVCPCLREPIRSIGGWLEVWYNWNPCTHSHAGFGIDDPRNNDSLFGRTYNQFIFANIFFDLTRHFSTGLEVSYWKTLYQETRVGLIPADQLTPAAPGKAVVIDWMVKYGF